MLARTRLLLVCLTCLAPVLTAQRGGSDSQGRGGGDQDAEKIKPYDEVITAEARTDTGLFNVHRADDKVFYEIPRSAMGLEMLWVTQIAQTQAGHGFGGTSVGNRVVRWQMRDEDVLLRDVKYTLRASSAGSVANSVASTTLEPIIATYPVKAWGKDQAAVIDVTDLYLGDLPEFSAKRRLNGSGVDRDRSFIETVRSFPENIESKVLMTYRLNSDAGGGGRGRRGGRGRDPSQGAVTVLLHHSMVLLPRNPMSPRVHDARVGFFSVSFQDYASDEHQVDQVRYIARWRLEKKDPSAEVSDPIKPIVFHVGRGVPEKWRDAVKQGIEAWQLAFAAAGFSNAIIAKDAPTLQEDPDWDAEDARYSTIRWLPSTTENASGPHISDPRTGEILESDIIVYHNVIKLVRDWYFVQASPMDPRAQQLPMPDSLIEELLAYVISHEVGHTLGFPHNMKASSSYTVEQLRDSAFTNRFGTEASIMDYGRFNYVAQPGDQARLIPIIGPYDFFAVQWGYQSYPDATTPEAEKPHLEALTARQVGDPTLRFGNPNAGEDPSQQTEDLSSDPILATTMGLRNLARVAANLVKATSKPGQDYELLRNMYTQVINQRNRELGHVASVVGGMSKQNLWYGQADRVFVPESEERQREAVEFLNKNAFQTPQVLLDQDILWRLESSGAADRILNGQRRLLTSLISDQRVKRMAEHAALAPDEAYLGTELMTDLRNGIWSELTEDQFLISLYRRNLQRAHVEILGGEVNSDDASTDLPALSRGQLEAILTLINERFSEAGDEITWMHLNDVKARIQKALDPKPQTPTDGR